MRKETIGFGLFLLGAAALVMLTKKSSAADGAINQNSPIQGAETASIGEIEQQIAKTDALSPLLADPLAAEKWISEPSSFIFSGGVYYSPEEYALRFLGAGGGRGSYYL